jgi:hypothetical protein
MIFMGLNDDQLRELGFSKMGHRSTHHPGAAASKSSCGCLFAAYSRHVLAALACSCDCGGAVVRPTQATWPAGRAAAELEEKVKVVQDPRVAEYGGACRDLSIKALLAPPLADAVSL